MYEGTVVPWWSCYGFAFNDLERPVITWVEVLISYLNYLGGVSWTGNQGFQGEARALSVFRRAERNKAAIFYLFAANTTSE